MSKEVKKTRTKPYRVLEEDLVNINMMLAKKGISFQSYVDNLVKKDIDRFLNEYKNGGKTFENKKFKNKRIWKFKRKRNRI